MIGYQDVILEGNLVSLKFNKRLPLYEKKNFLTYTIESFYKSGKFPEIQFKTGMDDWCLPGTPAEGVSRYALWTFGPNIDIIDNNTTQYHPFVDLRSIQKTGGISIRSQRIGNVDISTHSSNSKPTHIAFHLEHAPDYTSKDKLKKTSELSEKHAASFAKYLDLTMKRKDNPRIYLVKFQNWDTLAKLFTSIAVDQWPVENYLRKTLRNDVDPFIDSVMFFNNEDCLFRRCYHPAFAPREEPLGLEDAIEFLIIPPGEEARIINHNMYNHPAFTPAIVMSPDQDQDVFQDLLDTIAKNRYRKDYFPKLKYEIKEVECNHKIQFGNPKWDKEFSRLESVYQKMQKLYPDYKVS